VGDELTSAEHGIGAWVAARRARYGGTAGQTYPSGAPVHCLVCWEVFDRPSRMGPKPRTCSKRCAETLAKRQARGSHLLVEDGTLRCGHCGERFQAKRQDARYCSTRCRVAAHRARAD